MTETPKTNEAVVATPAPQEQNQAEQKAAAVIVSPMQQVFKENLEVFQSAKIDMSSLSAQAPEGATIANEKALTSLSEDQQKAVQAAIGEGFYITMNGQTFAPTKEGTQRLQARTDLTNTAQNSPEDRKALIDAGLWNEETNMPEGLNRLHLNDPQNADKASSDEEDKKAAAVLGNKYIVEGNWWERNKDWVIPLLVALAGTALGFILAKTLDSDSNSGNAQNVADKIIDSATNTPSSGQTQENPAQSNTGNATQVPEAEKSTSTQTPQASQTQTPQTSQTQTPQASPTPTTQVQQTQTPQTVSPTPQPSTNNTLNQNSDKLSPSPGRKPTSLTTSLNQYNNNRY